MFLCYLFYHNFLSVPDEDALSGSIHLPACQVADDVAALLHLVSPPAGFVMAVVSQITDYDDR